MGFKPRRRPGEIRVGDRARGVLRFRSMDQALTEVRVDTMERVGIVVEVFEADARGSALVAIDCHPDKKRGYSRTTLVFERADVERLR